MKTAIFSAAMAAVAQASINHWAVIVAGSNGYSNYRHQADAAHAYQIMKKNGISDDKIILMMYDDIRYNRNNPIQGKLFNRTDGPNVASNLKIDYSGRDVTPENFLAVLTGDSNTATGPVLGTNSHSKIFVYFTDHGAPGLIAFPHGELYADDLQKAFDTMKSKSMYREMTVYIEACESGSMFPNLKSDSKIYGLTASNAYKSSWGSYCGSEATVNGVDIGSCLGDLFSTNWMEDSDRKSQMYGETLGEQADLVKLETTKSPVKKFGDMSFQSEFLSSFQANGSSYAIDESYFKRALNKVKSRVLKDSKDDDLDFPKSQNLVDSRDIKLDYLYNKFIKEQTDEAGFELQEEIDHRMKVDSTFETLFEGQNIEGTLPVTDFDCLRFLMGTYKEHCGEFSDYSLKHVRYLSNHCETAEHFEIQDIARKMQEICQ